MPFEILGEVVSELRARRARGVRASELARFLDELGIDPTVASRFHSRAFGVGPGSFLYYLREDGLDYDAVGSIAEPRIDSARGTWSALPPYPDLANRRDREAFRAVARRRSIFILVCALDPDRDPADLSPPYLLHGVYEADTGANLWRPGKGEPIRAELNLALGGERIRSGSQDPWDPRNDPRAGDLAGPHVAVHCFRPGSGNVEDLLDLNSLKRWYESQSIAWPFEEAPPA